MHPSDTIYQWRDELMQHLPHLSAPQATELALWSLGSVLSSSGMLTKVYVALAAWLRVSAQTVRQRLRDFYLPSRIKRGNKRAELAVEESFADLFAWVLSLLPGKQVALALDASLMEDRFAVLCVSVLIGGSAVPVAWTVLPANQQGAWEPHWLALLSRLAGHVSAGRDVFVLSDRGLWMERLFCAIRNMGWHPLMRVNTNGYFKSQNGPWRPLAGLVPKEGQDVCLKGIAFKKTRLPSVLLAFWGSEAKEPWLMLTDKIVDPAQVGWYGLRMWIEHQFKSIKSSGLQCEKSRITDPSRVARLWLAYAVGILWRLTNGSAAEADGQFDWRMGGRRRKYGTTARLVSLYVKGQALLLAAIIHGNVLRCPSFAKDPWPIIRNIFDTS